MKNGKRAYRDYVLSAMPGTRQEIREKTGLSVMTIHRWTTAMHQDGDVHISGWHRPSKGLFTAIYSAGPGKDAACRLKHFTEAQKSRRYRRKMKSERKDDWLDAKERYAAAERMKRDLARQKVKAPQTWLSSLMP